MLVGVNGVGKSRLLGAIAINAAGIDALPASSKNERLKDISRNLDPNYSSEFSKVIVSSVSPFDKFPVIKRSNNLYKDYKYLGIRGISGENVGFTHMARVIGDLFGEIFQDESRAKICGQVLKYLGYSDSIELDFKFSPQFINCVRLFEMVGNTDGFNAVLREFDGRVDDIASALKEGLSLEHRKIIEADFIFEGLKNVKTTHKTRDIRLTESFFISLCEFGIFDFVEFLTIIKNFEFNSSIIIGLSKGKLVLGGGDLFCELLSLRISDFVNNGILILKKFGVRKINTKRVINLSSASSGEQSVLISLLGIAAYIKNGSLILIDEPEICLHPSWQERYISLLIESFSDFSECHFILATHSPQIISNLHDGNSFVIDIGESLLTNSSEFSKKSADFQLATVFHAPGYRNEYLLKQVAIALSDLSSGRLLDKEQMYNFEKLLTLEDKLKDDDPTKQLLVILGKALKVYARERLYA
ncbi:AAA family ATPase [Comamonas endophytica]